MRADRALPSVTSMILRFLFACAWYPFLPARGPWENTQVMSGLRAFDGFLFTPLVQWIIDGAAVSGGCFPERSRLGHRGAHRRIGPNASQAGRMVRPSCDGPQRLLRLHAVLSCGRHTRWTASWHYRRPARLPAETRRGTSLQGIPQTSLRPLSAVAFAEACCQKRQIRP